jgi:hypothetical protein
MVCITNKGVLMPNNHNHSERKERFASIFVFIFRNHASFFEFSPAFEKYVYYFDKNILNNPDDDYYDNEKLPAIYMSNFDRAVDQDKGVIVVDYYPPIASCTKQLKEQLEKKSMEIKEPVDIICLSFFHDDETSENAIINNRKRNLLYNKQYAIESMLDYPFIKKYCIPLNYKINHQNLTDILNDLYDKNILFLNSIKSE